MRVEWSAPAVADLRSLSERIELDRNLETANRITRTIYDAVQTLRRLPFRGRYGRLDDTRELIIPGLPWFVVYRVDEKRILVLNIVHAAQRWP